jgi:cytochrome c oxidase assembly protein subunit 11
MDNNELKQANARVLKKTLLVVVAMFGFGYALVPLYNLICTSLGINGQTEQIAAAQAGKIEIDKSRLITVTFDATTNSKLPWGFRPLQKSIKLHPGELKKISYVAENLSGSDIVGQAIHSVTPSDAARYFKKTECFCYSQQMLKSGESKDMPVLFMIDPALPRNITTVTLSYTFFNAGKYSKLDNKQSDLHKVASKK